jgi:hypothetical protein
MSSRGWRVLLVEQRLLRFTPATDRLNQIAAESTTLPGGVMERCKNVFEAILKYGHDEDWLPEPHAKFDATDAPAGSQEKIEILRKRLELGLPLWHDNDRYDYSGLTGAIRPRDSM